MSRLPPELTTRKDHRHGSKIGDLIRKLSSEREIVPTVLALKRRLEFAGVSFHELADHIEADLNSVYSAGFDAGHVKGVQETESKQDQNGASGANGASGFHNATAHLDWTDVIRFVWARKHHLASKNHEFIDKVMAQANRPYPREPSQRMHGYLHGLYAELKAKNL